MSDKAKIAALAVLVEAAYREGVSDAPATRLASWARSRSRDRLLRILDVAAPSVNQGESDL